MEKQTFREFIKSIIQKEIGEDWVRNKKVYTTNGEVYNPMLKK